MNPTANISLSLPQDQVQFIINALNQLPHGQVRPIIDSIVEQANSQIQTDAKPTDVVTNT